MNDEAHQEYDNDLTAVLEAVWGEGYMSPGGKDEVDRYLAGLDLSGKTILDIGCGLGGVDLHLASTLGAAKVVGIDIDQSLIDKCNRLAAKYRLENQLDFRYVKPGPFTFENNQFDIVTSKDSIIHIADKHALADDVYRVLKAGGWFAASDWLAGYDHSPTPEMQAYLKAEGLDFGLASANTYEDALKTAGFVDIEIDDRNEWYRQQARKEREQLAGALYRQLLDCVGAEFIDHQIDIWDKMIVALDQGQLRPTHIRGRKAD